MVSAYVSGDLKFTVFGDDTAFVEGEDSAIAGLPASYVYEGMVDVVRSRVMAEAAAVACCAMVGKRLHHANIVVTGDVNVLATVTDWTHCEQCLEGYNRAREAMEADPNLRMIGMAIYFAKSEP